MKTSKIVIFFLMGMVILLGVSGCTTRIADLTYVSTKNVSQQDLATATTDGERVTGEDVAHIILLFPTGTPNAEEALDRAIETKKDGIALRNATIHSKWFYIPYIYGESAIMVEGEVMVREKGVASK